MLPPPPRPRRSGDTPEAAPSPSRPPPQQSRPPAPLPAGVPQLGALQGPHQRLGLGGQERRRTGGGHGGGVVAMATAPPPPSAGGPSAAPWRRGGALCEAVVGREEPLPPPSGAEERPQPAGRPGLRGHPRGTRGGDTRAPAATPRRHFQHTMMLGSFSSRSSSSL